MRKGSSENGFLKWGKSSFSRPMGYLWPVPCDCRTSLSPMSRPDLLEVLFSLIIYWKSREKLASSRKDWNAWKVADLDKSFHLLNF